MNKNEKDRIHILNMKSPDYKNFLSVKCFSMKCLYMKCPVYEMFCL